MALSESRPLHCVARQTVTAAPVGPSATQRSRRSNSTQHVIRYVTTHASKWPEYARASRTVDRSSVRCTSLSRPFNAAAASAIVAQPASPVPVPVPVRQQRRELTDSAVCSGTGEPLTMTARPPRPLNPRTSGMTLSWSTCDDDDDDDDDDVSESRYHWSLSGTAVASRRVTSLNSGAENPRVQKMADRKSTAG